jgi:hypothetical protein
MCGSETLILIFGSKSRELHLQSLIQTDETVSQAGEGFAAVFGDP